MTTKNWRPRCAELVDAALAYDAAIAQCGNDPASMASFCTAEGDDLDALYARWITLAHSLANTPPAQNDESIMLEALMRIAAHSADVTGAPQMVAIATAALQKVFKNAT